MPTRLGAEGRILQEARGGCLKAGGNLLEFERFTAKLVDLAGNGVKMALLLPRHLQ
jgi:hypothetical protein